MTNSPKRDDQEIINKTGEWQRAGDKGQDKKNIETTGIHRKKKFKNKIKKRR